MHKSEIKKRAIELRKQGFSYSEILAQLPIAKSTLSLWLRDFNLSTIQKQRLTEKKLAAMARGWQSRRNYRLNKIAAINELCAQDISKLSQHDLWVIGIMLYWAEGSKERRHGPGSAIKFSNSDPRMIKLFILWLEDTFHVKKADLLYELYIHTTSDTEKALIYWSTVVSCDKREIKVYFKRHKVRTNRKNTGEEYNGLLRLCVRRSIDLNRKITAWTEVICKYWGVV